MARQESDKEDLIRDATAMVERAELNCNGWSTVITIGFFRDGRCTIYFDQDPYYQFDARGLLRRAYVDGLLYRSQTSTLARMDRHRPAGVDGNTEQVILQRVDLTEPELGEFREQMLLQIGRLHDSIRHDNYRIRRAVTIDGTLPERTLPLLDSVIQTGSDFIAPPPAPR